VDLGLCLVSLLRDVMFIVGIIPRRERWDTLCRPSGACFESGSGSLLAFSFSTWHLNPGTAPATMEKVAVRFACAFSTI
jgi:hypothetical protein